jgi:hypothetical protein
VTAHRRDELLCGAHRLAVAPLRIVQAPRQLNLLHQSGSHVSNSAALGPLSTSTRAALVYPEAVEKAPLTVGQTTVGVAQRRVLAGCRLEASLCSAVWIPAGISHVARALTSSGEMSVRLDTSSSSWFWYGTRIGFHCSSAAHDVSALVTVRSGRAAGTVSSPDCVKRTSEGTLSL